MKTSFFLILSLYFFAAVAFGQTTEFTYQGRLSVSGGAATTPHDFEFRLFTAASGGTQLGATLSRPGVALSNGVFTVQLDFGEQFDGSDRWLQIDVRPAGGPTFATLTPRQRITSAPYNIKSLSSDVSTNSLALGGVAANQYVITTDPRMTDARMPIAGSNDYIQNNPMSQQTNSSFNIAGNGTIGQTLTANVVSATQFNTGGARVFKYEFVNGNTYAGFLGNPAQSGSDNSLFGNLAGLGNTGSSNSIFGSSAGRSSNTGNENSFFGASAGFSNTGGQFNAFFGAFAGNANQTGNLNSFFGFRSGIANTLGIANAFFGSNAGFRNTDGGGNTFIGNSSGFNNSTGGYNTFVGDNIGLANTTGGFNTLLGTSANVGSNNLSYATAIGAGAVVSSSNTIALGRSGGQDTVVIPGTLTANGSGLMNLNASNITSGTLAIANGGTGSSTQNFVDLSTDQTGIGGNKTFTGTVSGNIVNATTQFNIGGVRMFTASAPYNDGLGGNFTASNTFVGEGAGVNTVPGAVLAGRLNSFFGAGAGQANTTGNLNSFFGYAAGLNNTTAIGNVFFGQNAGYRNSTGQENSFLGRLNGTNNVAGHRNTFVGANANVSSTNTSGNDNTLLGSYSRVTPNLSNQTAIGAFASVSQSNSLVLGSISGVNSATADTRVGIGTTAPSFKLEVVDPGATGLRVQTNSVGGTVASFGGYGTFDVDGFGVPGGRFRAAEDGTVTIGVSDVGGSLTVFGNTLLNTVTVANGLTLNVLGAAGPTPLCRNALAQVATCSSSIRYKQNINPFSLGLGVIDRLRPVTFNWKADNQKDVGLVAEEVAEIEPLLATYNDKGEVEGVKYDRIGVVLINAVREQQSQIDVQAVNLSSQEERITNQQTEIDLLRKQIALLRALACAGRPPSEICKEN